MLGIMQMLSNQLQRVAIFRPIIPDPIEGERDHDIDLLLRHFQLEIEYHQTYCYTLSEAVSLKNSGRRSELLETIFQHFKSLEKEYDFVVCEGLDYSSSDIASEYGFDIDIASNLGSPVLAVVCGRSRPVNRILDSAKLMTESFIEKGTSVLGVVINRIARDEHAVVCDALSRQDFGEIGLLAYCIPEVPDLSRPTVRDVAKTLGAKLLYGAEALETQVGDYVTAAMFIDNFLAYMKDGTLIITPGDRSDIILAGIGSIQSDLSPNIAGIVLTGGLEPTGAMKDIIEGWTGVPLPILSVEDHTYKTSERLQHIYSKIDVDNPRKIAAALGVFETHVNTEELRDRLGTSKSEKVTPLMFEYGLIEKAKENRRHIVLAEGSCERILKAAEELCRREVVKLTLLGNTDVISKQAKTIGVSIDGIEIVDPVHFEHFDSYVDTYFSLRQHKGIRQEDARDRMLDPTYFGTMMVKCGHADGMVSGAITTTAQTIRPAFEFIKTKPNASIVSSVFLMCIGDRVLAFADCAVNPNPTASQLAEIALTSAETARVFGIDPSVAMLSYSSGESGSGKDVQKVAEATGIAISLTKERRINLPIEGPIQYDAAIDSGVAHTKMPQSRLAGKATVLIFPDLNAGNNTYKAVQRSIPGSTAIGPILQGLNKPVNDLSRGCKVRDIVNTVAITAIQAQTEQRSK